MGRRAFLRIAGCAAGALVWADSAPATRLLVVVSSQMPSIVRIEWILYDNGQVTSEERPDYRCAVRITADSGDQGWADTSGTAAPPAQEARRIRDLLYGRGPSDPGGIWRLLNQDGVALDVLSAIDIALWDLYGRLEGKPVHALFGTDRQKIKAYASTGADLAEPSDYAQYALICKGEGLHGIRVGPRTQGASATPEGDMAIYSAVREAVGPDYLCLADGDGAYNRDEALQVGRFLDEQGYEQFRSPMPESDDWLDAYVELTSQIRTPVCAPSDHPGSYEARMAWLNRKACDVPVIDVHHGGFTACIQLASVCESAGVPLELAYIGPDAYPHVQLGAAVSESVVEHVEVGSPSRQQDTLPGRTTAEPVVDAEGYLPVPNAPGMGVELDWKYIFAHRVN
jgi:L-alanine-DL-glutamate epimerase-like enolase superfamily enzyme